MRVRPLPFSATQDARISAIQGASDLSVGAKAALGPVHAAPGLGFPTLLFSSALLGEQQDGRRTTVWESSGPFRLIFALKRSEIGPQWGPISLQFTSDSECSEQSIQPNRISIFAHPVERREAGPMRVRPLRFRRRAPGGMRRLPPPGCGLALILLGSRGAMGWRQDEGEVAARTTRTAESRDAGSHLA